MKKAASIIALVLALLMLPTIPVFADGEATTVSERPVFKYATLSFKGGVNMHFSVDYGDDASSYKDYGLIFWTESQEEADYTYAKAVEKKMTITHKDDAAKDTSEGYEGCKIFVCPVEAHKMGDSIYVQGYIENSDGTYTYSKYVREYSPQIYAKNKLYGASKTSDQKLVNMIKSLLNFGADAQIYFDYKTDNLVNSIIQTASSADTLAAAIANGGYVELDEDITLTSALTIAGNATINGNGKTISGASVSVKTGNNATFNNVVFEAPVNSADNASCLYASDLTGKIVIDGCTFKNTQWDCIQITPVAGAEIVINNCTFEPGTGSKVKRYIHIEVANGSACTANVSVTMTNNHFGSSACLTNDMIGIYGVDETKINYGGNNTFEDCNGTIWIGWSTNKYADNQVEVYAKLGGIEVSNAAGLRTALEKGGSIILTKDIDMTGVEWAALTAENAIILNGNGHTISNLKVRHYNDESNGVQFGFGFISNAKADVTIKKLTFKDADVGPEQAQIDAQKGNIGGVVMGYSYGKTVLEDVTVESSTVSGYGKLGCLIGYVPSGTVTLTNCVSKDNTINGGSNMGGLIGTVDSKVTINRYDCTVENITFTKVRDEELITLTEDVTVTSSKSGGTSFSLKKGSTFNLNSGWYYGYTALYYTVIANNWGDVTIGETTYKNVSEEIAVGITTISGTLPSIVIEGEDIVLSDDVSGDAQITGLPLNDVSKAGLAVDGGTLDGQGKTITVSASDAGVAVKSGAVKNVTIKSAGRGIMLYNAQGNIQIDSVVLDNCGYAINTGGAGDASATLSVTNSTVNGWSSWANLASASFTNCSFGTSTYYSNEVFRHAVRPYVTTTFTNCSFDEGFYIQLDELVKNGGKITLDNCTCNNVKLTSENFADYVKIVTGFDSDSKAILATNNNAPEYVIFN